MNENAEIREAQCEDFFEDRLIEEFPLDGHEDDEHDCADDWNITDFEDFAEQDSMRLQEEEEDIEDTKLLEFLKLKE